MSIYLIIYLFTSVLDLTMKRDLLLVKLWKPQQKQKVQQNS